MGVDVVFGANGPVGSAVARTLLAKGRTVRCVSRRGRGPEGAELVAGDAREAKRYCEDADVVYCCVGTLYPDWLAFWPPVVDGLAELGDRLVFADNLYGYGPQDEALAEDTPPNPVGRKPTMRAGHWRQLLSAGAALVRGSDFYGPGVRNAMLGDRVFPRALAGKAAQLVGDIDQPHAYTYVPDFARAMITIAEADGTRGQAWHVPNAPAQTTRAIVTKIFELAGRKPAFQVMPDWLVTALAWFSPLFREFKEMRFQWDRPYLVDHGKFATRFWSDATPLDEGLAATLDSFR